MECLASFQYRSIMAGMAATRGGLVGFGFINSGLYRAISEGAYPGLEIAFVCNRSAQKLDNVLSKHVLADVTRFSVAEPDLIVEGAHPDITRSHGEAFLSNCDYMPFSVTA